MSDRLTRAQQQQRTRQHLLDAAETLFGERGIHRTSLDEVAAEAGLTKGAIYANFEGKTGLVAAILERRLTDDHPAYPGTDVDADVSYDGWLRQLGADYDANLPLPEVRRFAMAIVEFWLYGMRTPEARESIAAWLRVVRASNAKEIVERTGGNPPMPADQLAALMTALDVGVAVQHLIDPDAVPTEVYGRGLRAILGTDGASRKAAQETSDPAAAEG
ncbi:TetR/AcrR family transcriptional regulator [Micromonospora sp. NBC_01796]|uniref:TetR/AcrR family transcriptional regulator n=1 Tax=Micromonospora sp. NBC_01796 TaxID=2975987 RepID=UPI002DDAB69E|nr:TetR/AcrR family transcriptional regulator [Micromonospora sp. NBC_01796]WSA86946.1 TetR/AcrR family transcriptional regulator [Micromonospora sp. NBC_01796]